MTRRYTVYELQSELLKGVRYGIIKGSVIGVAKEDTRTLDHRAFPHFTQNSLLFRSIPAQ